MTEKDRELEALLARMARAKVNRRGFLAGTGFAGLAAFLAACTGGSSSSPSAAASAAAPSAAASPSEAAPASASAAASVRPSAVAVTETEGQLFMYNWADYVDPDNIEIVAVGDAAKIKPVLEKFGPVEVYDTQGKKL